MTTVTQNAIDLATTLIKNSEGFSSAAYPDTGTVWTIGYGHTGPDVEKGMVITEVEGETLLDKDLGIAGGAIEQYVTVELTDGQSAALLDFIFNEGEGQFVHSTLLERLNQGDYTDIPTQLARWVYGSVDGVQQQLPGLVTRRQAEIALWNGPESADA